MSVLVVALVVPQVYYLLFISDSKLIKEIIGHMKFIPIKDPHIVNDILVNLSEDILLTRSNLNEIIVNDFPVIQHSIDSSFCDERRHFRKDYMERHFQSQPKRLPERIVFQDLFTLLESKDLEFDVVNVDPKLCTFSSILLSTNFNEVLQGYLKDNTLAGIGSYVFQHCTVNSVWLEGLKRISVFETTSICESVEGNDQISPEKVSTKAQNPKPSNESGIQKLDNIQERAQTPQ